MWKRSTFTSRPQNKTPNTDDTCPMLPFFSTEPSKFSLILSGFENKRLRKERLKVSKESQHTQGEWGLRRVCYVA